MGIIELRLTVFDQNEQHRDMGGRTPRPQPPRTARKRAGRRRRLMYRRRACRVTITRSLPRSSHGRWFRVGRDVGQIPEQCQRPVRRRGLVPARNETAGLPVDARENVQAPYVVRLALCEHHRLQRRRLKQCQSECTDRRHIFLGQRHPLRTVLQHPHPVHQGPERLSFTQ